jgi:hypothetical protein
MLEEEARERRRATQNNYSAPDVEIIPGQTGAARDQAAELITADRAPISEKLPRNYPHPTQLKKPPPAFWPAKFRRPGVVNAGIVQAAWSQPVTAVWIENASSQWPEAFSCSGNIIISSLLS